MGDKGRTVAPDSATTLRQVIVRLDAAPSSPYDRLQPQDRCEGKGECEWWRYLARKVASVRRSRGAWRPGARAGSAMLWRGAGLVAVWKCVV